MKQTEREFIALAGEECPASAKERLCQLKSVRKVFFLPPDGLIDSPIKSHPDTILCVYDGKLFCHEVYAEKNRDMLCEICTDAGLELCAQKGERNGTYPFDCAFNALSVPEKNAVIGRKKSLCPPLSSAAVNCNQGYAACAALDIGGTVLTADESVLKSVRAANINAVKISGGDISLPGYDTGFVGGCGGFYNNTLCVFGNPRLCKTGEELIGYCNENGIELISLCDGPLADFGGIKFLPLMPQ